MAIRELKTYEITCDSCKKKMLQETDRIPSTWEWRYDPYIEIRWHHYLHEDYEGVAWHRLLCCALCKRKYLSYQEVVRLTLDDVRRMSG